MTSSQEIDDFGFNAYGDDNEMPPAASISRPPPLESSVSGYGRRQTGDVRGADSIGLDVVNGERGNAEVDLPRSYTSLSRSNRETPSRRASSRSMQSSFSRSLSERRQTSPRDYSGGSSAVGVGGLDTFLRESQPAHEEVARMPTDSRSNQSSGSYGSQPYAGGPASSRDPYAPLRKKGSIVPQDTLIGDDEKVASSSSSRSKRRSVMSIGKPSPKEAPVPDPKTKPVEPPLGAARISRRWQTDAKKRQPDLVIARLHNRREVMNERERKTTCTSCGKAIKVTKTALYLICPSCGTHSPAIAASS